MPRRKEPPHPSMKLKEFQAALPNFHENPKLAERWKNFIREFGEPRWSIVRRKIWWRPSMRYSIRGDQAIKLINQAVGEKISDSAAKAKIKRLGKNRRIKKR